MVKALSAFVICLALLGMLLPAQAAPPPRLNFDLPALDGGRLSLEQFRGRVVIVEFFATWCGPCKRALPKLDSFAKKYADRGVSAIAFSVDQGGIQMVKPFVARLGLQMPVVLGEVKWAEANAGVRVLPTTLVIDPQGMVVHRFEGPVSHLHLANAVHPYLSKAKSPQPEEAKVKRRRPGDPRFVDLWVTDGEQYQGKDGLYVHTVVNVADLTAARGLWLALDISPQNGGQTKTLYLRVDDVSVEYFVMFVACDQLPPLGDSSSYVARVSVLDEHRKAVDSSPRFPIAANCGTGGAYARSMPEPQKFTPPTAPAPAPPPAESDSRAVSMDAAQGRIKSLSVTDGEVYQDKPGLMLRVNSDLGDLPTDQGLWMAVNLWPEDAKGRALTRDGDAERLYHRVDSTFLDDYLLFVRCDQLPALPPGAKLRMWITVVIGKHKTVVARSKEFVLAHPCQLATQGR
ncbi:MAG: TlpA family protein disulfide reductase [Desulfarculaceae bacterium]|nr:TlpA family protein disulfide reductase [Desulfarculaceae bacterium]MCF8049293.1 TlpA family protein disulfide reductase [Desulfarculaceae bacterium]MCF8097457.1 TlpA family protein disulfide reductase [Desulfarculaceae bacterium]MCF8122445.1 TlpA family protein disulfide reductase [Desulfarculaceae bacterium]